MPPRHGHVLRVPGVSMGEFVFVPRSMARLAFLSRRITVLINKGERTPKEEGELLLLAERYRMERDRD